MRSANPPAVLCGLPNRILSWSSPYRKQIKLKPFWLVLFKVEQYGWRILISYPGEITVIVEADHIPVTVILDVNGKLRWDCCVARLILGENVNLGTQKVRNINIAHHLSRRGKLRLRNDLWVNQCYSWRVYSYFVNKICAATSYRTFKWIKRQSVLRDFSPIVKFSDRNSLCDKRGWPTHNIESD